MVVTEHVVIFIIPSTSAERLKSAGCLKVIGFPTVVKQTSLTDLLLDLAPRIQVWMNFV